MTPKQREDLIEKICFIKENWYDWDENDVKFADELIDEIEKLFPKVYPVSVEPQEEMNYCIGKKNGKYLVVLGKYIKATDEHAKLMSITKSFWSVPNITPEYYIPESEFLKLLPEGIK